ncbi:unnamed protein product [Spirodela intermedia]|uniref:MLO-like protein n=2 Tax=Spirodela intermedia TaxID=51605 RepID=A0A7I8KHN9_SPIIN|nr:unnamed protein product [Spirodela intermedia]CAA6660258.1 unnamed protein product [Spirodela intermedia]CAA7396588.1 unnamed protein product [Spirodela intermedia]
MAGGSGEDGLPLRYTPTWVLAIVCFVIVFISVFVERVLHWVGKYLKKRNQTSLFEALQKVKEELMLLGFISLLLTVSQNYIQKICIPGSFTRHMLPCKKKDLHSVSPSHYQVNLFSGILGSGRRLLAGGGGSDHCAKKGKVPLLSLDALHKLHIFIFVLAVTHVVFCAITMLLGMARIRQWKRCEDSLMKETGSENAAAPRISVVNQFDFIKERFKGFGKDSKIMSWVQSFCKQFYGSVTKSDYTTLRRSFIMTHCRGNPNFNFHKYMIRVLESDFKKVVGISWYLWVFLVLFLLVNVKGWHMYFWLAFVPLIMLLAVGTKLEHVITQLAHEVAEKHCAIEGDLIVKPSDDHFWFHRPRVVLYLVHFILFQNAFEIAFFFWILVSLGFESCTMGHIWFIVPRLVIGVFIQVLCGYSTLPLYALVTQMGTKFKKEIFDEHVQVGLIDWAEKVKKRKGTGSSFKAWLKGGRSVEGIGVQLQNLGGSQPSKMEEGNAGPGEVRKPE